MLTGEQGLASGTGSNLLRDPGEILSLSLGQFSLLQNEAVDVDRFQELRESSDSDRPIPNPWNFEESRKVVPTADRKTVKKTTEDNQGFVLFFLLD